MLKKKTELIMIKVRTYMEATKRDDSAAKRSPHRAQRPLNRYSGGDQLSIVVAINDYEEPSE